MIVNPLIVVIYIVVPRVRRRWRIDYRLRLNSISLPTFRAYPSELLNNHCGDGDQRYGNAYMYCFRDRVGFNFHRRCPLNWWSDRLNFSIKGCSNGWRLHWYQQIRRKFLCIKVSLRRGEASDTYESAWKGTLYGWFGVRYVFPER